jgi:hypothetical protein
MVLMFGSVDLAGFTDNINNGYYATAFANAQPLLMQTTRSRRELTEVGIYQKLLLVNWHSTCKMNGILITILSYLWIES